MNIVVCIKQILNKKTNKEGFMISDYDRYAIELGNDLKKRLGGTLIVISMGPKTGKEILDLSILMGADRAILLADKTLSGSDTYATAYVLAKTINTLEEVGVVICGKKSLDGDTGQVGPQIATMLDIPHVTYVTEVQKIEKEYLEVQAKNDMGYHFIRAKYPCLLCVEQENRMEEPLSLQNFGNLRDKEVELYSIDTIGLSAKEVGQAGSKTRVFQSYEPENISTCEYIDQGSIHESVKYLLERVYLKGTFNIADVQKE